MDFGIHASAVAGLTIYDDTSRGSGRTTSTLERLKEGDILVAYPGKEANRLERILRKDGRNVQVISAQNIEHLIERTRGERHRVVLDHTMILHLYLQEIERLYRELMRIQATREEPCPLPPWQVPSISRVFK